MNNFFYFLTVFQADLENQKNDKNEVEPKSKGKSDNNLDNPTNNQC